MEAPGVECRGSLRYSPISGDSREIPPAEAFERTSEIRERSAKQGAPITGRHDLATLREAAALLRGAGHTDHAAAVERAALSIALRSVVRAKGAA